MDNPEIDWSMSRYMSNPNFKLIEYLEDDNMDAIEVYGLDGICINPNLTWDDIKATPDLPWRKEAYYISKHPNITWDIIKSNPDYPWDWSSVTKNPNITCDIIKANPEYPFVKQDFSENPNFKFHQMLKLTNEKEDSFYSYNWFQFDLAMNDLDSSREEWISIKMLIIIKTLQIQRHWRRCSNDPSFKLAKRLITNHLKV